MWSAWQPTRCKSQLQTRGLAPAGLSHHIKATVFTQRFRAPHASHLRVPRLLRVWELSALSWQGKKKKWGKYPILKTPTQKGRITSAQVPSGGTDRPALLQGRAGSRCPGCEAAPPGNCVLSRGDRGVWVHSQPSAKANEFQRLIRSSDKTLEENHLQMEAKEAFSGFFFPSLLTILLLLVTGWEFPW